MVAMPQSMIVGYMAAKRKMKWTTEQVKDLSAFNGFDIVFSVNLGKQNNRYDHPKIETESIAQVVHNFFADRRRFNIFTGY